MSELDDLRKLIAQEQDRLSQLDDVDYFFEEQAEEIGDELESKGDTRPGFDLSDRFRARFPQLSRLLSIARVTPITAEGEDYLIVAWLERDERTVWLCHSPTAEDVSHLHPDHQLVAAVLGGIIEFEETLESRLANQYWVLKTGATETRPNFDVPISRFTDAAEIPAFDFEGYVTIAYESNGAQIICHRVSGEVLMISHDPDGDITPLDGWPVNSFFTIDDSATFQAWVEGLAAEYLDEIDG